MASEFARAAMLRQLPNLLSAARLVAAPLTAGLALGGHDVAALAIFAAASFSDVADGFIARRWGLTSRFGAWLDPAADKLLMLLCLVALLRLGVAPVWLVALVLARDGAIVAGLLAARGFSLPLTVRPLILGKAATLAQAVYVGIGLLVLAMDWDAASLIRAAGFCVAALTLLSGAAYARLLLRALQHGGRTA